MPAVTIHGMGSERVLIEKTDKRLAFLRGHAFGRV